MAIRTLSEHSVRMAIHFFVNFAVSQPKLAWLTPDLGILWTSVCSYWLCGSIVAYPVIYILVPSPFRFEIRQCHHLWFIWVSWGPFLERPGNLTGPKSYFEIKVSRKVGCVLTSNEVHIVSLADNLTVQCSNHFKLLSGMENKTA